MDKIFMASPVGLAAQTGCTLADRKPYLSLVPVEPVGSVGNPKRPTGPWLSKQLWATPKRAKGRGLSKVAVDSGWSGSPRSGAA